MHKTEIRPGYYDRPLNEWTLDEHHYNDLIMASSRIDEVRMNYYNGKLSHRDIRDLSWAIDWLAGNIKDISEKLDEEGR